jgi:hypothetical protein
MFVQLAVAQSFFLSFPLLTVAAAAGGGSLVQSCVVVGVGAVVVFVGDFLSLVCSCQNNHTNSVVLSSR